jgi:hypothetical protein
MTPSGIAFVLVLAGSLTALTGRVWIPEAQAGPAPAIVVQLEAPDEKPDNGSAKSWWQRRVERRRERAEAYRERVRPGQQAAQNGSVERPLPVSAEALSGIDILFKLDPRLTKGLYMGDRWVSGPTYSGAQQDAFTVEVRAQGLDFNGQPVTTEPEWIATDPDMVTIAPRRGDLVTITVRRAGVSRVRVTVPGQSEDTAMFTELWVKAASPGALLAVDIFRGASTTAARPARNQTVRNGWMFVDDEVTIAGPSTSAGRERQ